MGAEQPKVLPAGRTLAEFEPLGPAEEEVRAAARSGTAPPDHLKIPRPETKSPINSVRASFVRFLALGGDNEAPVHEHGVYLIGRWIAGDLDLEGCNLVRSLLLRNCVLEGKVIVRDCTLPVLGLPGTHVEAIEGDRLHATSSMYFTEGFQSTQAVELTSATIGGDLELHGGKFKGKADTGALTLERATVGGTIIMRDMDANGEYVALTGCTAAALDDNEATWANTESIDLTGFSYGALTGPETPMTAAKRIEWLRRQPGWSPQPWEQLAKVFRTMGLPTQAEEVAIAKQKALANTGRYKGLAAFFHWLYGATYGYGYRPIRLGGFAIGAWIAFALFFWWAASGAAMQPTDGKTLADPAFAACRIEHGGNWTDCPALGTSYPSFQPFVYSLDIIVPLLGLNQAKAWTATTIYPCADASPQDAAHRATKLQGVCSLPLGIAAAFLIPIETLLGWLVGLMVAAVAGGFIRRD